MLTLLPPGPSEPDWSWASIEGLLSMTAWGFCVPQNSLVSQNKVTFDFRQKAKATFGQKGHSEVHRGCRWLRTASVGLRNPLGSEGGGRPRILWAWISSEFGICGVTRNGTPQVMRAHCTKFKLTSLYLVTWSWPKQQTDLRLTSGMFSAGWQERPEK